MKTIALKAQEFASYESPLDIMEDADAFNALRAIIWITRTHYGEKISLDEAVDFPMDEFLFGTEEDEETEAEAGDPKETPTDSAADAEPPQAETRSTSKT